MNHLSLKFFMLFAAVSLLSACSSSSSSVWVKKSSPWEQRESADYRKSIDAEAPASESDNEELAAVDQSLQEVELSYQTEPVESFIPQVEEVAHAEEGVVTQSFESNDEVASSSVDDILNLPANYYTVQLMASVDVDRVYKYAEKNQLSTRYVVATQRNGTVWHVLLLGVYVDYASAKSGMNSIIGSVKIKPWVRKLAGIQKLMQ